MGLVNHLPQPAHIKPPPFVALHHITKVMQCPVGTLFDSLAVESANGNPAIAGRPAPVAPPLEDGAVLAVPAAIALLLRLAGADLDGPPADGGAQGGKSTVSGRAVGEVDKAIARVARADGVDGDVDLLEVGEAIGAKHVLNDVGLDRVEEVTCSR